MQVLLWLDVWVALWVVRLLDHVGNVTGDLVDGDVLVCGLEAIEEFYLAFGYSAADVDAIGDAGEVCVFELDAGALVAVVEEDVEAGGGEVGCDFFAGGRGGTRP